MPKPGWLKRQFEQAKIDYEKLPPYLKEKDPTMKVEFDLIQALTKCRYGEDHIRYGVINSALFFKNLMDQILQETGWTKEEFLMKLPKEQQRAFVILLEE